MTKNLAGLLSFAVIAVAPAFADVCQTTPGNVVANCGFENGVYTSTVMGETNSSVPNSWIANFGFDLEPGFNHVESSLVYQGTSALQIGNDDDQPVPQLSQTFTDISGATYSGSLYVDYGGAGTSDTLPFFNVLIDNNSVLSLDHTAPGTYTRYTFSFTGTGSDTLALQGNTSPSEWFVDNITVTTTASAVPEPGEVFPLAGALVCGAFYMVRRRRANQS